MSIDLEFSSGPRAGDRLTLDAARVSIGRDQANEVSIPDRLVSRRHGVIERDDDGRWSYTDASSNGSFVNGERIARGQRVPLGPGDEVAIGDTTLRVTGWTSSAPVAAEVPRRFSSIDALIGHLDQVGGVPGQELHVDEWFDGRYELETLLGRSSTSVVVAAVDTRLGRRCVLKFWVRAARAPQLLKEARYLFDLNHRNVVRIYDYGEGDRGRLEWIAMQDLGRETLRDRLRGRDALFDDVGETLIWAAKLARAVQAVQDELRIAVLDLKPENVMFLSDGEPVVIDLGSASPVDHSDVELWGTRGYIAPELFEGRASSPADVFSLGAVIYECLVGTNPLAELQRVAPDRDGVIPDHAAMEVTIMMPAPRRDGIVTAMRSIDWADGLRRASVPEPVVDLVTRMCAFDAAQRPTVAEAAGQLEAFTDPEHLSRPLLFISHASDDKSTFVEPFARALERSGFRVWLDSWKLRAGDPFWRRIGKAIREADYVVVVLSTSSVQSEGVRRELKSAFTLDDDASRLLPIRIDPIPFEDLPEDVRSLHVMDFVGWGRSGRLDELVRRFVADVREIAAGR